MLQTLSDSTSTHCLHCYRCSIWFYGKISTLPLLNPIHHPLKAQSIQIYIKAIRCKEPANPPPTPIPTPKSSINPSTSVWSPYFFKMARCPLLYNSPERKWTPWSPAGPLQRFESQGFLEICCSQVATNVVLQDLKASKSSPERLAGNSSHGHWQDLLFHLNTQRRIHQNTEAFCQNCQWLLPASQAFPDALNALARQIFGAVNQDQLLYIRFAMHGIIWVSLATSRIILVCNEMFTHSISALRSGIYICILPSSTIYSTPTNSIPLYTKHGNSWEAAQAFPNTLHPQTSLASSLENRTITKHKAATVPQAMPILILEKTLVKIMPQMIYFPLL